MLLSTGGTMGKCGSSCYGPCYMRCTFRESTLQGPGNDSPRFFGCMPLTSISALPCMHVYVSLINDMRCAVWLTVSQYCSPAPAVGVGYTV